MKPLIVLLVVFIVSLIVTRIARGNFEFGLSGRIALSAMLLFTAIAHFAFTKGMTMMLPDFIPFKIQVVYLTGMLEIAAAVGILFPSVRVLTAWLLIVLLVCMLPANIYAAMHKIDYQNASFDGNGVEYLWFRIPLQLFFVAWTYLSGVKG